MTPPCAFGRWGLDAAPAPTLLACSTNEIWTAHRAGELVYLRLTPGHHRAPAQVGAELAFLEAAHAAGLRVVRPVPSCNGRLLETEEGAAAAGQAASVACFTAAPGRHARKPDDMTAPVLQSWAGLMADLHHFAQHAPGDRRVAFAGRPRWQDDRVFLVARQASDGATRPAQRVLGQLEAWMTGLPTDADAFGLTHADLHFGNMSIDDGGRVTAFDFDDSCHHWFAHDLAVAVTSIRKAGWEHPGRFDAAAAEIQLVEAYRARRPIAPIWHARLEAFVAYRIALSACWASRSRELGELDPGLEAWFTRSLPWWLSQLEERRPAIDRALAA